LLLWCLVFGALGLGALQFEARVLGVPWGVGLRPYGAEALWGLGPWDLGPWGLVSWDFGPYDLGSWDLGPYWGPGTWDRMT